MSSFIVQSQPSISKILYMSQTMRIRRKRRARSSSIIWDACQRGGAKITQQRAPNERTNKTRGGKGRPWRPQLKREGIRRGFAEVVLRREVVKSCQAWIINLHLKCHFAPPNISLFSAFLVFSHFSCPLRTLTT